MKKIKEFRYKILAFVICVVGFLVGYSSFESPTIYDEKACQLKDMEIKERISKVVQSHELVFYVDKIDKSFPFYFDLNKDSYREINEIQKGEIYMLPIAGDSIFKQAGSKFVKFKRRDKIFIESIIVDGCN